MRKAGSTGKIAAMVNDLHESNDNIEIPRIHPGELLKVWLMENPAERLAEIVKKTELTAQEFQDIADCKSSIDAKVAAKLEPVFHEEVELYYRMQFAFDTFQRTGRAPNVRELPILGLTV